jgi:3-phenylpropionate/trans-cinnamate dioxygenase ferredoxin reductase subunit
MGDRRQQTFIIVGASLAGAKAAETLRNEGFAGRLILIGEEHERPYERPPLSKEYLRGDSARSAIYVHPEGYYAEQAIELRTGTRVSELDVRSAEVVLDDGQRLRYDRLLLTPGAEPRRLDVPGAELDGVHYLRSSQDSDVLRERFERGGRLVVVGAGWIGSEVAAVARERGLEVTMVAPGAVPLEHILGAQVGAVYGALHAERGVELLLGTRVAALEGRRAVEAVRTTDGRRVECDLVVVGAGVKPRAELAARAGLAVDDGIVVDECLQTSAAGIFAAGDAASAWHPLLGRHLRVEHWANALNQGPAAAQSMLDAGVSYERVPYFFSDQYDVGMEYSGFAVGWDSVVFRGDPATRVFIAFWLKDGRVLAGMNVNVWDVADRIQHLIRRRVPVDAERLADLTVSLDELALHH